MTCSVEHNSEEIECFEACMECAPSVHGDQDYIDGEYHMRSGKCTEVTSESTIILNVLKS